MDYLDNTVTPAKEQNLNFFLSFEQKLSLAIERMQVAQIVYKETANRQETFPYLQQAESMALAARENKGVMVVLV